MFAVIENTPGYLPDADEVVQFETLEDAQPYLDELHDQMLEQGYSLTDSARDGWFVYSYYQRDKDDLGRIITCEQGGV
jgi:hypothetical protein